MKKLHSNQESTTEIKRQRTTLRNSIIAAAILAVALASGSSATQDNTSAQNILWASISGIGVLVLVGTMIVSYRQADELQKLNQLKAAGAKLLTVFVAIFAAQMLYAIFTINLVAALQIIFIGGILVWSFVHRWLDRHTTIHD